MEIKRHDPMFDRLVTHFLSGGKDGGIKAEGDSRTISGYAATWDLDHGGDVIQKGAFAEWLQRWRESKTVVPLLDTHNPNSIRSVLGHLISAHETERGLWTVFSVVKGPDGDALLDRVRGGHLSGLSIGFVAVQHRRPTDEERRNGIHRILQKVDLREVSVVVFPMNPAARANTEKRTGAEIAPDDPRRIRQEEMVRDIIIRDLSRSLN